MAEQAISVRWQGVKVIGMDEDLPVQTHHNVYPFIDPSKAFEGLTYAGQVVLIVGASSGIGREVARFYARAGAAIAIVARTKATLDETKSIILAESHNAQVLVLPTDVKDYVAVARAVESTTARFGKIDILIVNAGTSSPLTTLICDKDPDMWWNTFEVNVRGVFNFVRAALPHIRNASGRIITTSSVVAQLRLPMGSDYCASKHTLGRLVELIAVEYPNVKIFNVHPGAVQTPLSPMSGIDKKDWDVVFPDPPELAAATMLYLTTGKADWLSGRYMSVNWDLGEVVRDWKDKIIATNGLVSKLFVP